MSDGRIVRLEMRVHDLMERLEKLESDATPKPAAKREVVAYRVSRTNTNGRLYSRGPGWRGATDKRHKAYAFPTREEALADMRFWRDGERDADTRFRIHPVRP